MFDKAEPIYIEAMNIRLEKLGEAHPDYIETRINLAGLRFGQGRLEEAEEQYLDCIEKCREHLGSAHPLTLSAIYNLGELLTEDQDDAEAGEPYNREAYFGRQELLGDTHVDTLQVPLYHSLLSFIIIIVVITIRLK